MTLLKKFAITADEIGCRFSNGKIHVLTQIGKVMLPEGCWGHGPAHESPHPTVYMTFDDGPHPATTPLLLELLERHNIKATFFLVGQNCERYPELVQRIHDAGHTIGNHTYSHILTPFLSTAQLKDEIRRTNRIIEEITGIQPHVFRPPFGLMDERTARCLKQLGMTPVYWNSAPEDWLNPGSHRIVRRVMWKITDGALIVLHEGAELAEQTITAASEIISRTRTLGYQFSKVKVRA